MTRALLRKEFRSLLPFVGLVVFLNLLGWADVLLTRFPDQFPLHELLDDASDELFLLFVIAFALAAGLVVREADEGTLTFLDGLPVSRTRVFFTKTFLALGVLWLIPLSDLILRAFLYSWSRTSLEQDFLWLPMLTRAGLDAAAAFIFLAAGLALSFLRRFSLLVLGLLACGYLMLREFQMPYLDLFNVFELANPSFRGRNWEWPLSRLMVQVSLGLGCLAIAYAAFQLTGDAGRRLAERLRRRWWFMAVGLLSTVTAAGIWIGLFIYWAENTTEGKSKEAHYAEWPTSRARTARYLLLYPENRAGLAAELIKRADDIETKVREFLRAKPIASIVADLTSASPHTAGVANWKQVRVDLNSASSIDELTAVFAHETTHVYIDHESEEKISSEFNSTRFFHEGLATYVEYRQFRPAEKLERSRRVAAVAHARNQIRLEELMDSDALSSKYDTELVYPLGEVFVNALVEQYGADAPGKVLRAFVRPNAPKDLKGPELWRDIIQSWGGNLSEVEDAFYAELNKAAVDHKEFVDSLPRLRGAAEKDDDEITVRVSFKGESPGMLVGRFRPAADTPDRLYEYQFPDKDRVFRVSASRYNDRTFWYQLGWTVPGASHVIYEPWVEASVK